MVSAIGSLFGVPYRQGTDSNKNYISILDRPFLLWAVIFVIIEVMDLQNYIQGSTADSGVPITVTNEDALRSISVLIKLA